MIYQINISDIISFVALILSAYTIKKTVDFNKRQNKFIETNDKLNKLLLEKENEEYFSRKKADLSANFANLGRSKFCLKVFNRGNCVARNVQIEIIEGKDLFIQSELDSKFPVEILERQQGIDLICCVVSGSSRKAKIKLIWDDDYGYSQSNIVTPVL